MSHLHDMLERATLPGPQPTAEPAAWVESLVSGKWTLDDVLEHLQDKGTCAPASADVTACAEAFKKFHESVADGKLTDRQIFVRFVESHAAHLHSSGKRLLKHMVRNAGFSA